MNERRASAAGLLCVSTAALVFALLVGCGAGGMGEDRSEKPAVCTVGEGGLALSAWERLAVGQASPYPAEELEDAALAASMAGRRAAAWRVVEKMLAPVAVADEALGASGEARLPRWRTFYGGDEVVRMLRRLYAALSPAEKEARASFSVSAVDAAMAWNAQVATELGSWSDERWLAYVEALDEEAEIQGLGGIGRVGLAPGAARHLLGEYAGVIGCAGGVDVPAWEGEVVEPGGPVLVRERGVLGRCDSERYGPFAVAPGEALTATLAGSGDADLYVGVEEVADRDAYACASRGEGSEEACVVTGPALVYVTVDGYAEASEYELTVAYESAEARSFAPCFAAEMPPDAALVKASWHRLGVERQVPVYDTSAARMQSRLAASASGAWGDGDGFASPAPEAIYTVALEGGSRYGLTGLHMMTKELRHWMWITLWWSPEPDTDFGADRPDAIRALGPPWDQYKMCVVVDFREGDADPGAAYRANAPSLAAALDVVAAGQGAPTWCSNPYLEAGENNARTNCIGCHQHAGSTVVLNDILEDGEGYPHAGRTRARASFPADYLWSLMQADNLARAFADEIEFYDAAAGN